MRSAGDERRSERGGDVGVRLEIPDVRVSKVEEGREARKRSIYMYVSICRFVMLYKSGGQM